MPARRSGSTGFGGGVALPHAKIEGLDEVFGYFARLTAPIDFQSVDDLPVDLVFLILSPPDAGADHLKALAGVSRALRDRANARQAAGRALARRDLRTAERGRSPACRLTATRPPPRPAAPSCRPGAISGRSNRSTGTRRSTPCSDSELEIVEQGFARIRFEVSEQLFHAAGAAHGTLYFKMMDDAAFYACNSLVTDRFLLTTAFNLHFTRPLRAGPVDRRGALGERQEARVRRRRAADRCRRRGGGARNRHLHALAHPLCRACRATIRAADERPARHLGYRRRAAPQGGGRRRLRRRTRQGRSDRRRGRGGAASSVAARRGSWSASCSRTAPICGRKRAGKGLIILRKVKRFRPSSHAGGDSTRICGWWNWISRPQNGSPLK